jgi:Spy/CpxP family protein refolding chaperone
LQVIFFPAVLDNKTMVKMNIQYKMKGNIMKVTRIYLTVLFLLSFSILAFAQPGPGPNGPNQGKRWMNNGDNFQAKHLNLPNLTDEQKEQIAKLRTENMKAMLDSRNQIQEKMARLHTLQTADKPDMNAINSVIDEIAELKATMAKTRAAHRQKIRSLLTDEQRVIFDSKPMGGFGKGHQGMGQGRRHRQWTE